MSVAVRYKAAARADIRQAVVWYEAQATGLGAEFMRSVALVEAQLSREPALYAPVRGPIRRAVLRKFPYAFST